MTIDLSLRLSDWGSDSVSNYPDLATALGMSGLDNLRSVSHVTIYPNEPAFSYLVVRLLDQDKLPFLACYDQDAVVRAYLLGEPVKVQLYVDGIDSAAQTRMEEGNWVNERFKIVHMWKPTSELI